MNKILRASAAYRWIACPGSPYLEQDLPDSSSEAAQEGTRAHSWSEKILKDPAKIEYILDDCKREENKISGNGSEMIIHVRAYIEHIGDNYFTTMRETRSKNLTFIERKVAINKHIGGTLDYALITKWLNTEIHASLRDLKYGKGGVAAKENWQQIIYALGIDKELKKKVTHYEIGIFQPRGRGKTVKTWSITGKELRTYKKPLIDAQNKCLSILNQDIEPYYNVGSHCFFCKARKHNKCLAYIEIQQGKNREEIENLLD